MATVRIDIVLPTGASFAVNLTLPGGSVPDVTGWPANLHVVGHGRPLDVPADTAGAVVSVTAPTDLSGQYDLTLTDPSAGLTYPLAHGNVSPTGTGPSAVTVTLSDPRRTTTGGPGSPSGPPPRRGRSAPRR